MNYTDFLPGSNYPTTRVSELTGKRHDNVLRDVEVMCAELNIDVSKYSVPYRPFPTSKWETYYSLPTDLVYTLVTKYDVRTRAFIIRDLIAKESWMLQNYSVAAAEQLLRANGMKMFFNDSSRDKNTTFFNLQAILLSTTKYAKPMTSLEIEQETAGQYFDGEMKTHNHILRDIDNQFKALGEDPTPFLGNAPYKPYPNSTPRDRRIYCLDIPHTMILMTGYYTTERYAVIRRWLDIGGLTFDTMKEIENALFYSGWSVDVVL